MEPKIRLGDHVQARGNILDVALWYPRSTEEFDTIEVELIDVRAADSIRIKYDFERDGWIIEQASTFQWEENDTKMDSDWQEVSFIKAWGRKVE